MTNGMCHTIGDQGSCIPGFSNTGTHSANGSLCDKQATCAISRNSAGLQKALEHLEVDVRFNTRAKRPEWRTGDDPSWQANNERLEARIRETIESSCSIGGKPARFGRDSWPLALNSLLFDKEVDPFCQWLESLPGWDGTRRIEHLLDAIFEVPEEYMRLASWAARHILLGAVWRANAPGTKLDEIPVLMSAEQGIGKSTLLAWLLPEQNRDEWFADGLHLAAPSKVKAEGLLGRVIVEVSEMAGSGRAELESLKAFVSRTNDGTHRMAYRRDPEPLPRTCVIVGTTNDDAHLPNDPTGNRRFVSVVVRPRGWGTEGVMEYVDEERNQLWAEAYYRQGGGEEARLPDDLKARQGELNDRHRRSDFILEDRIHAFLAARHHEPFTLAEAALGTGLCEPNEVAKLNQREQRRLGAALRNSGCEKRQTMVCGKRSTLWENA